MWKLLLLLALFCPIALAQTPAQLVGKYQMEVQDGDILVLRADGTASLAGDETRWSAQGNQLQVGPDVMTYAMQGDRLVLSMGGIQLVWRKLGGGSRSATKPRQKTLAETPARSEAAGGADPQDAQVRQVLMGNAWCSFSYNKVSGASSRSRVVFRPDGQLFVNSGGESYSSGYGGSYAGQSDATTAMRWRVAGQRLYVDAGEGAGFQDVGLSATRNSNGSLILHANGTEYSVCN